MKLLENMSNKGIDINNILDILNREENNAININDVNEETKALAQKFGEIIESLIENEDIALDFLEEHGDEIEWD